MFIKLLLIFLTSFALGLSLYPVFIRLYLNKDIVDKTNLRKVHTKDIPTMGGVPLFLVFLVSTSIWISIAELQEQRYIIGGLIFIFFLGLRDDFVNLNPTIKLISQIVPATIIFYLSDIRLTSLYGLYEGYEFPFLLSFFITIFTIIVITNSFNLIDGLDGLLSTISLIVLIAFGSWFTLVGQNSLGLLLFAMAGAIVAFLTYNWQPAKIFMGDTGALVLGFFFSIIAIKFININYSLPTSSSLKFEGSIATSIAVIIFPLFDTLRIFTLRIIKKSSPFIADSNHTHHFFLKLGFSHAQTVVILALINLVFIGLAIIFRTVGDPILVPSILCLGFMLNLILNYLLFSKNKSSKTIK